MFLKGQPRYFSLLQFSASIDQFWGGNLTVGLGRSPARNEMTRSRTGYKKNIYSSYNPFPFYVSMIFFLV
jgi:hypothetical protein